MKASEILQAALGYDSAMWAPNYQGVQFSCSCGCGGDNYDAEEFAQLNEQADKDVAKFHELCEKLGVEWDLIEVQKIKL
jgi:enamine deaminase RidA (YjgF/YER057c/UK114 family)